VLLSTSVSAERQLRLSLLFVTHSHGWGPTALLVVEVGLLFSSKLSFVLPQLPHPRCPGESDKKIIAGRLVALLQQAGAAAVIVHGRTMEQRQVTAAAVQCQHTHSSLVPVDRSGCTFRSGVERQMRVDSRAFVQQKHGKTTAKIYCCISAAAELGRVSRASMCLVSWLGIAC